MIDITPDEEGKVADVLRARGVKPQSLGGLLADWNALVDSIERGYSFTIYDYRNDLGSRNLLDYLCQGVSSDLAGRIVAKLSGPDERFMAATIEYPPGVVQSAPANRWWYFRRPRILLGELKQDFED